VTSARQHYDQLLGAHYTWSVAGDADPFTHGAAYLARHGLADFARYLDLGAGFGAHAVPLARAGKHVTAVDFHAGLLAELRAAAPSITTHEADLVAFLDTAGPGRDIADPTSGAAGPSRDAADPAQAASGSTPAAGPSWDAILCLGDTITHLPDRLAVQRLLTGAARVLATNGVLALGYRDYSGPPRSGLDRFIPVRADAHRSLLCCVEAIDADHVAVTDILTTAGPAGLHTQLGTYPKLRVAPIDVAAWAAAAHLRLDRETTEAGMLLQLFRAAG
jgi:SAM-dependent methyltransferase